MDVEEIADVAAAGSVPVVGARFAQDAWEFIVLLPCPAFFSSMGDTF